MRLFLTPLFVLLIASCGRAQSSRTIRQLDSLRMVIAAAPNDSLHADALLLLSGIHENRLRQYDSAFHYSDRALLVAHRRDDVGQQLRALNGLAAAQLLGGNTTAAAGYHRDALALARERGAPWQETKALLGLAVALQSGKQPEEMDSSRALLQQALAIAERDSVALRKKGWEIYFETAKTIERKDNPRRRRILEKALRIAETRTRRRLTFYSLAELEEEEGRLGKSVDYYRTGLALEPEEGSFQKGMVQYGLGYAFRKMGDADSTYKYMNAYASALHANADRRREQAVADAEARFQTREKQAEIDRLALEDELSKAQIARQRTALTGGLILLGLLGAFLYFLLAQRRRIIAQNATIKQSLLEKNTLLREIHHRVKNNLQIVSSLLSLQENFIEDAAALDAIEMGGQRVRSMAIIHQRLYLRDEVTTAVSARDYLDQLVRELLVALNVRGLDLRLNKHLEDIDVDIDRMIPLGLVANEVITNALKHAFTGRERGELTVRFERTGPDIRLLIADNGAGGEFTLDKPGSFGNLLIRTFTEQLEGELVVDSENGTSVELVFPAVAGE